MDVPSLLPGAERPLLTVVVPVYNGGDEIVENVEHIREAIARELRGDLEVVVVSDGSIDGTAERLLERRSETIRVIHYDRNLGKGYAVKLGSLGARGEWVALVDSDLDVDPSSVPAYLAIAQREELDFAIGSKRHPESIVQYPRSRQIASWLYQQLNRLLFRLDVRDTQVGLKVFSRRVVDDVVPLLLVKQFAFDLELLAVAAALGRGRISELPVRLDYRFTGSMLGSSAVARALWDTIAIFYRLRILRTYQRKRRLLAASPPRELPLVSVVGDHAAVPVLDYPRLESVSSPHDAHGELLAVLKPEGRPSGNWVSAAVPFFGNPDVVAVVTPTVAPLRGSLREVVAAAVVESHLGGGSRRSSAFPGNLRTVVDYEAGSFVVRRSDYLASVEAGVEPDELVAWLSSRGRKVVYTPDASVAARQPPLVRPHLSAAYRHGAARGRAARRARGRSVSAATALSLAPTAGALLGVAFLAAGAPFRKPGLVLVLLYAGALVVSGIHAGIRFRSFAVGLLEPPAIVPSQGAYLLGFARGLATPARSDSRLPRGRAGAEAGPSSLRRPQEGP